MDRSGSGCGKGWEFEIGIIIVALPVTGVCWWSFDWIVTLGQARPRESETMEVSFVTVTVGLGSKVKCRKK